MPDPSGIPGLVGAEHIGFTVPDIDEAEKFLIEVIGCTRVYELGPFRSDDDWMRTHLGVHPRTVMREVRLYRCAVGPNFEVFQYEAADEQRSAPKNSDIGGHHVALYVEDFERALQHLREHNVEIMGEPTASRSFSEGQTWVYFKAPWGMQFELVSFPEGKAYERTNSVKLWHPADPAG